MMNTLKYYATMILEYNNTYVDKMNEYNIPEAVADIDMMQRTLLAQLVSLP